MNEIVAALTGHPFFTGIEPALLERLASVTAVEEYPAGAWVARSGAPADTFYVVLSGRAGIEIAAADRDPLLVATVHAGEVIGCEVIVTSTDGRERAAHLGDEARATLDQAREQRVDLLKFFACEAGRELHGADRPAHQGGIGDLVALVGQADQSAAAVVRVLDPGDESLADQAVHRPAHGRHRSTGRAADVSQAEVRLGLEHAESHQGLEFEEGEPVGICLEQGRRRGAVGEHPAEESAELKRDLDGFGRGVVDQLLPGRGRISRVRLAGFDCPRIGHDENTCAFATICQPQ